MLKTVLNIALFYATWLTAVLGAARGDGLSGLGIAAIALTVHLALSTHRIVEARLVLCCALLGFSIDTLLAAAGLMRFSASVPTSWPCPAWMLALWIGFGTTLNGGLAWMKGRPSLAALLGLIGGPAAYLAAYKAGAIQFQAAPMLIYTVAAVEYGTLVPLMLWFASACGRRRAACVMLSAKNGVA